MHSIRLHDSFGSAETQLGQQASKKCGQTLVAAVGQLSSLLVGRADDLPTQWNCTNSRSRHYTGAMTDTCHEHVICCENRVLTIRIQNAMPGLKLLCNPRLCQRDF